MAVVIALSKPQISLTAPQDGATYAAGDKVVLAADAAGRLGVKGVEFYVDGTRVGTAADAPYVTVWTAQPGTHTIQATAYSPTNQPAQSAPVTITVAAATPVPVPAGLDFHILAPANNSTISDKSIVVLAAAPSDALVARVSFLVDGVPGGSADSAPFGWTWATTPGTHTLLAIALAADGHELARDQSLVYVQP